MRARNTGRLAASLVVAGLFVAALFWLQGAASTKVNAAPAAADLFASSTGTGITPCLQTLPCPITVALAAAADGDTVYVETGIYTGSGPSVITISSSITPTIIAALVNRSLRIRLLLYGFVIICY